MNLRCILIIWTWHFSNEFHHWANYIAPNSITLIPTAANQRSPLDDTTIHTWVPSTRIPIFFNPQLFPTGFTNFPSTRSVFKSNSPVHTHPMVSGFTVVPRVPLQYNEFRACVIKRVIVAANLPCRCCCAIILIYCSVRDWTRICYVIWFENIRSHPSTRFRIAGERI